MGLTRQAAPLVEREAALSAECSEPERPAPLKVEDDRRRNWIGLVGVLFLVGFVMVAGVWFLGASADGSQPATQPTDVSLPAVEGSLDALADFTERSAPTDAADDQPEPADASEASPVEAPVVAAEPSEPAGPSRPAPAEQVSIDPAEIEPTETAEPVEPIEPPTGASVEVDEMAPVSAPAAQVPAVLADPVSGDDVQEGPRVEITTRVEPCRFGSSCLVAGFTMHEFETAPQEFICEFASGSRFTFRATSQTVDHACATGSPGDSITIEVAGVRSATVVHE